MVRCPVFTEQDYNTDWAYFEIADTVEVSPSPIYLRIVGLSADPLTPSYLGTSTIHPDQKVVAVIHYVDLARSAAELAASECEAVVFWDDVGRQMLTVLGPYEP
jgi:hypothetical protein